jgi:rSAM/selenodomain-associated transferase 1
MISPALLMVFVKNPIYGQVKTRLAEEVGPDKALSIYRQLLTYTRDVTKSLDVEKIIYYSDSMPETDLWANLDHKNAIQPRGDLGQKMAEAFQENLRYYGRVIIIGSDNPELQAHHLNTAFEHLKEKDVVIGPAKDGGYYLLGMRAYQPALFQGISWSTNKVWEQTISKIQHLSLSYATLPTQNDIDTYEDWKASAWHIGA